MADYNLNCRGMQCPGPIMQLFQQMKSAQSGDMVTIHVTDMGFKKDIEAWCRKTKNELFSLAEESGVITAIIRKG
ncbi:MAG TPA: sulfurtransferase TusA family protein [Armatimonadota bacterium]|nr:sulfurtransferase TusA family protein [Armatimonadota bacterium]